LPPDDNIVTGDVDTTADTLNFPSHGLQTGDVVFYANPGFDDDAPTTDPDIAGLTHNREYNALVIDSSHIALGNEFNASTGVDDTHDLNVFSTPHNFKTGDQVKYDNPTSNLDVGGLVD